MKMSKKVKTLNALAYYLKPCKPSHSESEQDLKGNYALERYMTLQTYIHKYIKKV